MPIGGSSAIARAHVCLVQPPCLPPPLPSTLPPPLHSSPSPASPLPQPPLLTPPLPPFLPPLLSSPIAPSPLSPLPTSPTSVCAQHQHQHQHPLSPSSSSSPYSLALISRLAGSAPQRPPGLLPHSPRSSSPTPTVRPAPSFAPVHVCPHPPPPPPPAPAPSYPAPPPYRTLFGSSAAVTASASTSTNANSCVNGWPAEPETIYDTVSPLFVTLSSSSSAHSLSSYDQFTSGRVPTNTTSSPIVRSGPAMSAELAQQKQELGERLFLLVRALHPSTLFAP